ncbi:MAG: ATP-binding protein, partial [Nitrospirota bacterium]|nr:ATP-binding protein [Nitrospirota bacterium]
KIVSNVGDLDDAVNKCVECHHSPEINNKLKEIKVQVDRFKTSLSYYITASANGEMIKSLRKETYNVGTKLLDITSEMALIANQTLQKRTRKAIADIRNAQRILIFTLFLAFLIGLWIAVTLTRSITRPVRELIAQSRKIAEGDFGSTTDYYDLTEFGELAASFNEMSLSLRESNERIVMHMNRLSGLYRMTLPLYSASSIAEIIREVSFGMTEFIDVEQCGLMLLDNDSEYYEHKHPASGLNEEQINSIKMRKDDLLKLYLSSRNRPLIINNLRREEIPVGLLGDNNIGIRNIMLGWVMQKGELTGVIRLANKHGGGFTEESYRLIGIISNNVSVAIENIKLYEDMKARMQELKETQEQLLQAAKLAAVGELASNVAHEINNPLTSIMGYAELAKDETDIEIIMKDIDIIEKESIRARDIVQQLLEFSRKKPLKITEVDINSLLRETVSLIDPRIRDAGIKVIEQYSDLPLIMGDPNQLKQVFLNIINNAVSSLSWDGGKVSITTGKNDAGVFVEIGDNGCGIPDDVLPRIFEPYFTTKRNKGTGLGLSISYKIIQSHNGRIDVRSREGEGAKFTVSLPVYTKTI